MRCRLGRFWRRAPRLPRAPARRCSTGIWRTSDARLASGRPRRLPRLERVDAARALWGCILAAVVVWAAYASTAPLRLEQVVGVDLTRRAFAQSLAAALTADLVLFMIVFLVAMIATRVAGLFR